MMMKKMLLAGTYLSGFFAASLPLQATQHHATQTEQHHTPPKTEPQPNQASGPVCPPCVTGGGGQMALGNGQTGFILIPYGAMGAGGAPCGPGLKTEGTGTIGTHGGPEHKTEGTGTLQVAEKKGLHEGKLLETMPQLAEVPVEPGAALGVIKAGSEPHKSTTNHKEEELEKQLHNVQSRMFLRKNPHNGQEEREMGKELNGKVYFQELGRWVSHPVIREATTEPTGTQEPVKAEVPTAEPTKTPPTDPQAVISKAKRTLHSKDGKSRWTRFISEGGMDKWYVQEGGKWVLWDENPTGQARPAQGPKGGGEVAKEPADRPFIFSSTNRSYAQGPKTYNPVVPGANETAGNYDAAIIPNQANIKQERTKGGE